MAEQVPYTTQLKLTSLKIIYLLCYIYHFLCYCIRSGTSNSLLNYQIDSQGHIYGEDTAVNL